VRVIPTLLWFWAVGMITVEITIDFPGGLDPYDVD